MLLFMYLYLLYSILQRIHSYFNIDIFFYSGHPASVTGLCEYMSHNGNFEDSKQYNVQKLPFMSFVGSFAGCAT